MGCLKKINKIFWLLKNIKLNDIIPAIKNFKQKKTFLVEFKNNQGTFCVSRCLHFLEHYQAQHISSGFYLWNVHETKIHANLLQFHRLHSEYLSGTIDQIYHFEYQNKTVIDIGSYVGESALYFLKKGAEKVICFEPVPQNYQALELNLKNESKRVITYNAALSGESGWVELCSDVPMGELSFGGHGNAKSPYKLKCKAMSLKDIINSHPADVIKMDCEGAEHYIAKTPIELIQKIPYWIVETHSRDLRQLVGDYMQNAGFLIAKDFYMQEGIDVIHFFSKAKYSSHFIQNWNGNKGDEHLRIFGVHLKKSIEFAKEIYLEIDFEIVKPIPDLNFCIELLDSNHQVIANIPINDIHHPHLTSIGRHTKNTLIGYHLDLNLSRFKEPCKLKIEFSSLEKNLFLEEIQLRQCIKP